MKILFLCTSHNSLSQRLYLALSTTHDVSIEYVLSDEVMISACTLAQPDLIICPFLTTLVPKKIYSSFLTLIIHPGPPGDVGPSALDWVLMGDEGSVEDPGQLLHALDHGPFLPGRTHWGVTVLQAIEEFDAGPVWAFEQFAVDIDRPRFTKSDFYRGPVTTAAISATFVAIARIQCAALSTTHDFAGSVKAYNGSSNVQNHLTCSPQLQPDVGFETLSVTDNVPFQGGIVHDRPLLKAAERDFDSSRHTALQISRRIRSGDSQPGALSKVFGRSLYVYGGMIEDDGVGGFDQPPIGVGTTDIVATRSGAVCVRSCDGLGIWITHTRRPKSKTDKHLWPKVPAIIGLVELGILCTQQVNQLQSLPPADWSLSTSLTLQEVWVTFDADESLNQTAYLHFDFYNGGMSADQCSHLIEAMDYIMSHHTAENPLRAVVLMGGAYFSNGIALNVIEAAADPAMESWLNINRIDDVVHKLLHEFPTRGILTIAAMRGNAAAGGVALGTACDFVIAGSDVVLNPAYRAVGLHGSEYHTLSYHGRCGRTTATQILRSMTPMSPVQAQAAGLIDFVFPSGPNLDDSIRFHVHMLLTNVGLKRGNWKANVDLSPASLAHHKALELGEMSRDFWSARSTRYHTRRLDFVRKVKAHQTPLRFATHRRIMQQGVQYDEEELDSFDDVAYYEALARRQAAKALRDEVRNELSLLVSKWAMQEELSRGHRRGSVVLDVEKEMAHVAMPGAERKTETVFSCYYKPVDEPMTPPKSPFQEEATPMSG